MSIVTRGYLFSRGLVVTAGYGVQVAEEVPSVTDFGAAPWRVPKKRPAALVGRGKLRASRATLKAYGDITWDDQNEDALMLVMAD